MIALGNSTTTITATLSGAKNTNDADVTCFFTDEPATTTGVGVAVYDKQQSTTNGVTAATILSAGPAGVGFRRRLKSMTLFNADLAAITVTIKIVDSAGPTTTTLQKVTLQTLEQLVYEEGFGFAAYDVNGALKSQAANTSGATSTADSKAVQASSQASSVAVNTSTADSKAVLASSQASSLSLNVSSNLSTFTAASSTTSSQLSLQTSAGTSTTLSKTKSSFGF